MQTRLRLFGILAAVALVMAGPGCRSPRAYREEADKVATQIVEQKQQEAFGRTDPFTVLPPAESLRRKILLSQGLPYSAEASLGSDRLTPVPHWPEKPASAKADVGGDAAPAAAADAAIRFTLAEALAVGAANSRDYQSQKETVFRAALALDLQRDAFRNTFSGTLSGTYQDSRSGANPARGEAASLGAGLKRKFQSGASIASSIALDLSRLLTGNRPSSRGIVADVSVTAPLLAGSGAHIVTESMTQAERDVLYALYRLERYRRTFAVRVASQYLSVLQQRDQIRTAEQNYRGLVTATRRARRLADSGRLAESQVDEAQQKEYQARDGWISAQQSFASGLDQFKVVLGLPADARIDLDQDELKRLADSARVRLPVAPVNSANLVQVPPADAPVELAPPSRDGAGPLELDEDKAVRLGLEKRLDLRILRDQIEDAQRAVVVAADALRAGLNLTGRYSNGGGRGALSGAADNASLNADRGDFNLDAELTLPWEKTRERNAYRTSLLSLEQAVRDLQDQEDQAKLAVRSSLRKLGRNREGYRIQSMAVQLAEKRVRNTDLLLQAGRTQMRDVLDAQDSLLTAQNNLTSALVTYRVTELELQRDLDVLEMTPDGLWREYTP